MLILIAVAVSLQCVLLLFLYKNSRIAMNPGFGIQESMMLSSDRPAGPFVATFSTQRAPAAAAVMLLNEEMMMETGQAEVAANKFS